MQLRSCLSLSVVWLTSWVTPALASEMVVELERPPAATCVSEQELGAALFRSGLSVSTAGSSADGARVRIAVTGTPDALSVVLRRDGSETVERLEPATCETATDVAAAFVISTLSPAPVVPVERKPKIPVAVFERAIGDELARRKVQLARLGASLELEHDTNGDWAAVLGGKTDAVCEQRIALGVIDELTEPAIGAASDGVERALSARKLCVARARAAREAGRARSPDAVRAHHLRNALDDVDSVTRRAGTLAAVEILAGSLVAGVVVLERSLSHDQRWLSSSERRLLMTGSAIWIGGGTAALLAPDDHLAPIAKASNAAAAGFFWGSFWRTEHPAYVTDVYVAAGLSTAWLVSLDAFARQTPVSRLRQARGEFAKSRPSRQRMAEIEKDLRTTEPVIPAWVSYAPIPIAGAIGLVASSAKDDGDGFDALIVTGGFVSAGLAPAFWSNPHGRYQENLRKAGLSELSFAPGPGDRGGLTVSGKF